jgi:YfiH family protein
MIPSESSFAAAATPEVASLDPEIGVVMIEAWHHLPWLRAGFSTRQGGQTTVYSGDGAGGGGTPEQNLGWTPEDPSTVVARNRRQFVSRFPGFTIDDLVTVRQLHGDIVRLVERGLPLATAEGKAILTGDGLTTIEPGLLLGVQTADCVPVLLADQRTHAVAAIHAGWRGTVARIVEHGVAAMRREFNSQPEDLIAAIGPAIGPCCFAVGDDVRSQFQSAFAYATDLLTTSPTTGSENPSPHIHLNLWEANRRQLLSAGLAEDAITVVGECTACTRIPNGRRKYFSHRAERGYTGRMLSVIGVPNA